MHKSILLILHYKSRIYEFPLPASYQQLITHCETSIDPQFSETSVFNYLDSEGDMVQISSEYDYKQAIFYLESTFEEVLILSVEEYNNDAIKLDESFEKTNDIVRRFYAMKIKEKALKVMKMNVKIGNHFINLLNAKMALSKAKAFEAIIDYSASDLILISNSHSKNNSNANNDNTTNTTQIELNDYINNHIKQLIDIGAIINRIKNEILTTSLHELSQYKSLNNNNNNTIHYDISCAICNISPIRGIRYKCSVCPNYNLCQYCEENNDSNSLHPHDFLKLKTVHQGDFK